MALSMLDCAPGTIVDHTWERRSDGKRLLRETRRRGMIMKVDGDGTDSIHAVYVLFKPGADFEKVDPGELNRVFPRSHPKARAIFKQLTGQFEDIGAEFSERRAPVKPKLEDALGLTKKSREDTPLVLPEGGLEAAEEKAIE